MKIFSITLQGFPSGCGQRGGTDGPKSAENGQKVHENRKIAENGQKLHENQRIYGILRGGDLGSRGGGFSKFSPRGGGSPPSRENPDRCDDIFTKIIPN